MPKFTILAAPLAIILVSSLFNALTVIPGCDAQASNLNFTSVRIKNYGAYVAKLYIYYEYANSNPSLSPIGHQESAHIAVLQQHTFRVPLSASFENPRGVDILTCAIFGKEIFYLRVSFVESICFNLYGTTLINSWKQVTC